MSDDVDYDALEVAFQRALAELLPRSPEERTRIVVMLAYMLRVDDEVARRLCYGSRGAN